MKAAVLKKYSKTDNTLMICDVPVPKINKDEVLVKVKAAGVNPLDHMIIRGEVKLIIPYQFPLIMGNEFSGVIEEVGKDVIDFKPGDRIYGRMPLKKIGAFAEYVAINQNAIAKIPSYLSYEEAASIPLTALTALQAFDLMDVKPGQKLFISGGTGSLGAMAIPLAKSMGLYVMTSGSIKNKERVMKLGVDQFIDYKTEDYSLILKDVDLILDTLGDKEIKKEFQILKHGGCLVSLRGMPNGEFARRTGMSFVKRLLFSLVGSQYDRIAKKRNQKYIFVFVHEDGIRLQKISEILQKHKIETSIDKIFHLSQINEALLHVENGGSKGKTIIKMD